MVVIMHSSNKSSPCRRRLYLTPSLAFKPFAPYFHLIVMQLLFITEIFMILMAEDDRRLSSSTSGHIIFLFKLIFILVVF